VRKKFSENPSKALSVVFLNDFSPLLSFGSVLEVFLSLFDYFLIYICFETRE